MKTRKVIRNIQKWMMQTMALTAVLLAGSCNNEEFAEENGRIATNGKTPVSFRVQNGAGAQLKATSTTLKTIGAFVVNAINRDDDAEWITSDAVVGEGKISRFVLNGVTVYHDEYSSEDGADADDTNWSYSPEAYFPIGKGSDSVEFFAYSPIYPVGLTVGLKDNTQSDGADSGPTITYEVPKVDKDGKTNQQDLLVAYAVVTPGSGGTGTDEADYSNITSVKLKFRHALSRVLVQAKKASINSEIIIDSIKLIDLKYQGTLMLAGNTSTDDEVSNGIPRSVDPEISNTSEDWVYPTTVTATTDYETLWNTTSSLTETFDYVLPSGGVVVPTTAKLVTTPEQGMYVMPQTVPTTFGLKVVYRVNNTTLRYKFLFSDSKIVDEYDENIPNTPITFEIGKQYLIEISFTSKNVGAKIKFVTDIDDYDDDNTINDNNSTVMK
jgi:hypothetical protein